MMTRVGSPCNVQVLDLEVTKLLAETIGHMSTASGAIARGLCDCFNSRDEILVRSVPFARAFSASVQMIIVKRLVLVRAQLSSVRSECRGCNAKMLTRLLHSAPITLFLSRFLEHGTYIQHPSRCVFLVNL